MYVDPECRTNVESKDSTSDYDDSESLYSDLTSLKSSALHYVYENGRRYHAYQAGKYVRAAYLRSASGIPS